MKPKRLEIGMLKFMKSSSNTYDFVELKPQLLHIFPEEKGMEERIKMKRFLDYLTSGGLIEKKSQRGIMIIVEAGEPVKRDDISVIAKLTPKGAELLEKDKSNYYTKFGIISAFLISLFSLGYSYIKSQNSKQMEIRVQGLSDTIDNLNTELKKQKSFINSYQKINLKLQNDILQIESQIKTEK